MAFKSIPSPSPNFNARPVGAVIDTIILHYTGMKTAETALRRMCDPASEVSAHFMIEENGTCHRLVEPEQRAWHAGVSHWRGRDNMNHTSIGIELVNPGHEFGYKPFPDAQIDSLLELLHRLESFSVPRANYIGHSDVAPSRKTDPGELFPWKILADHGYGVVASTMGQNTKAILSSGDTGLEVRQLKKHLRMIGYDLSPDDIFCDDTRFAVAAFQRHWRQSMVTGTFDTGTQEIVMEIIGILKAEAIIAP